jgi:hypothetical protein
VDDAQKNALLGEAVAYLMPITWKEPFGIVDGEVARWRAFFNSPGATLVQIAP